MPRIVYLCVQELYNEEAKNVNLGNNFSLLIATRVHVEEVRFVNVNLVDEEWHRNEEMKHKKGRVINLMRRNATN